MGHTIFGAQKKPSQELSFLLASSKTYTPNTVYKTSQHLLKVEHRLLNLNESQRKPYDFGVHVNLHLHLWTLIHLWLLLVHR